MKKKYLILIAFVVSSRLFAQPWNIEEEFQIVFISSGDTNFIYKKSSKGNDCLIEAYSKTSPFKKVFDYTVNRFTKKKNGPFNLFDNKEKWYCSMLFRNDSIEELLMKSLDSTLSKYRIVNNVFNGVYAAYFPNGKIKEYGFYKDNARVGEWIFYYDNGKIRATGSYSGNYVRLTYDYKAGNLISTNKYFDTIKVEKMTDVKFDSLKSVIGQDFIIYPVHLHYETGVWKYYNKEGLLIKEEIYSDGKMLNMKPQ